MTSVRRRILRLASIGSVALAALTNSPEVQAKGRDPMKIPGAQYEPVTWAAIDGWADDDQDAAFQTFLQSCKAILSGTPSGPMATGLYHVCQKAVGANPQKPGEARAFFEKNFKPVRIAPLGTPDGFVTGYYEPIVEGKRDEGDGYEFPLYRKPASLLDGGRMAVAGEVTDKKKKHRRKLVAFYDRSAIDDGVLSGRNLEICWLRDPIDSFFIHIQGSVRVRLDDGKMMRLNYQAANGHPYYAVGRWLIDKGYVSKDDMSMDRIRQWMMQHPAEGEELRRRNKSYVFFRETNLSSDQEPIGAQGISLTPGRSIAVDHRLHTYGTPFFISAYLPIQGLKPDTWFKRLMIAQDTGGAIVGPARADLYFGAGDEAESVAGRLRNNARFVMLLPKELDPTADSDEIPLPRPRPEIPLAAQEPAAEPTSAGEAKPSAIKPEKPAEKPAVSEAVVTAKPSPSAAKVAKVEPSEALKTSAEKKTPFEKGEQKKVDRKPEAEKSSKPEAAHKAVKTAKLELQKPERTAEKKTKKKSDKESKPAAKSESKTIKVDAWEARVMPVLKTDTASAEATSQQKSKKKK